MGDILMYGLLAFGFGVALAYILNRRNKAKEKYRKYSNSEKFIHFSGVTLLPSTGRYLNFDRIVEIYEEVQLCTGLKAEGPDIEFLSYEKRGLPWGWGHYMPSHKRVLINTDNELSQTAEDELYRHEFIHHILEENDLHDESFAHDPKFFSCGPGVSTDNGKVLRP